MAGQEGTITVEYKKKPVNVRVTSATTVGDFKKSIQAALRIAPERQGLKLQGSDKDAAGKKKEPVRLSSNGKKVLDYPGVTAGCVIAVSDLGPQIGYRTVFVVEYLGPILIMLAYATRPAWLYGAGAEAKPWDPIAQLGLLLWVLHFLKREVETFFVHKFSRPTMPLFNLFKNSMYYWGFALGVGYVLCHPDYTAPKDTLQVQLGVALMAVSELVNAAVHVQLSRMRPAEGSDARDAPKGFLFSLVSCPNYTAEVLSWVGFTLATQIAMSGVFTLVGLLQMTQWAVGKHVGYLKSDPAYKKLGRKAIIPFII